MGEDGPLGRLHNVVLEGREAGGGLPEEVVQEPREVLHGAGSGAQAAALGQHLAQDGHQGRDEHRAVDRVPEAGQAGAVKNQDLGDEVGRLLGVPPHRLEEQVKQRVDYLGRGGMREAETNTMSG